MGEDLGQARRTINFPQIREKNPTLPYLGFNITENMIS